MITHVILQHSPTPTYFRPQANRSNSSTIIDITIPHGRIVIKNVHTANDLSSNHLPISFEIGTSRNH